MTASQTSSEHKTRWTDYNDAIFHTVYSLVVDRHCPVQQHVHIISLKRQVHRFRRSDSNDWQDARMKVGITRRQ